jgi:hypothetical protein
MQLPLSLLSLSLWSFCPAHQPASSSMAISPPLGVFHADFPSSRDPNHSRSLWGATSLVVYAIDASDVIGVVPPYLLASDVVAASPRPCPSKISCPLIEPAPYSPYSPNAEGHCPRLRGSPNHKYPMCPLGSRDKKDRWPVHGFLTHVPLRSLFVPGEPGAGHHLLAMCLDFPRCHDCYPRSTVTISCSV